MNRELIVNVIGLSVLCLVLVMFVRYGYTQNAISNCKQPFGSPPCNFNNNATFDNGAATGCTVDFHWLRCDNTSHGSVYDSCKNNSNNCREVCECSCSTNGYGRSWYNNCLDVVQFQSYSCNGCPTQSAECSDQGMYWNFIDDTCYTEPVVCSDYCEESGTGWLATDFCSYLRGCPSGFGQPDRGITCCWNGTPILLDVAGNGFNLTNASSGVMFDIIGDGRPVRVGWTQANSDDAWLTLDRNNNGTIDDGRELFGNFTPQTTPPTGIRRNGFLALSEYDKPGNGGNGNGLLTKDDRAFALLRLWQDVNHNGISEPSELHTLNELGIKTLELDYKESKRTDGQGNQFKYRAKVKDDHDQQSGRWAWDVVPVFIP